MHCVWEYEGCIDMEFIHSRKSFKKSCIFSERKAILNFYCKCTVSMDLKSYKQKSGVWSCRETLLKLLREKWRTVKCKDYDIDVIKFTNTWFSFKLGFHIGSNKYLHCSPLLFLWVTFILKFPECHRIHKNLGSRNIQKYYMSTANL